MLIALEDRDDYDPVVIKIMSLWGHLPGSEVEHATLDLGVISLSPMLGAEFT